MPMLEQDEQKKENVTEKKEKNTMREMINLILYIGVVIIAAILLNKFVIQKVQVDGVSMRPSLENEEQLILEKVSYYFTDPDRYDIVVFNPPGYTKKTLYIKRIIGVPGDTVQVKDGCVYINDELLDESYGLEEMYDAGLASDSIVVGEDQYFVLGDNRNNSEDSRDLGLISKDRIVGKAVLRLWPLNKFGLLK